MSHRELFPLFLDLTGRVCLVVGAGAIAEGKIAGLLNSGAQITVVSPEATPEIQRWAREGRVGWVQRTFVAADLEGTFLVIAATAEAKINAEIHREARLKNTLCNAVDDPDNCDLYYPAVVRRGPLQIAVSTAGNSPALAQRLRVELEALFGPEYGDWVSQLGSARDALMNSDSLDPEVRRKKLHQLASRTAFDAYLDSRSPILTNNGHGPAKGKVYLLGAGPGDPELLTVKADRILRSADVVLHDELVGEQILRLARPDATLENVGKRCGGKHYAQANIHEAMVRHARAGRSVVRLKGGDPMLFGRAGEEMEALRAAGVGFEIVPGITAALGAASQAAITLTHRESASSVLFLSGHRCTPNASTHWRAAIETGATLVIYMPGDPGATISSLLDAGLSPDTPCALISKATLPDQQVYQISLARLTDLAHVPGPRLLIVGEVAAKANELEERTQSAEWRDKLEAISQ